MRSPDDCQMVSVVMPLYNVAPYVSNAIESVLDQTYPNIEIVIVDDGSSDASFDIAKSVLLSSGAIRWQAIQQENKGVSSARNKGAHEANGDWIIFLDPDDVLAPRTVEQLVRIARIGGLEVVVTDFALIDESSIPYKPVAGDSFHIMQKDEAIRCHLLRTRNMAAPATMVSSHIAAKTPFREGCRYGEDVMWVWEVISNADQIGYLQTPGYGYRLRSGSTITAPDSSRIETGATTFLLLDDLLENAMDDASWAASRWMLGVMHVLARYGSREQFRWFYSSFYRKRIISLLTFPQVRVRLLALVSMLGPGLLKAVLGHF